MYKDAGMEKRETYEKVRAATVAICAKSNDGKYTPYGSGVNVDPSGIVVTCSHVFEAARVDQQKFVPPAKPEKAELILFTIFCVFSRFVDGGLEIGEGAIEFAFGKANEDIAIYRLHTEGTALPFLDMADSDCVYEGQRMFTCGFPLGTFLHKEPTTPLFSQGIISSIRPHPNASVRKQFLLDMTINPGNSGGPLCSEEDGQVVGIVNAAVERKETMTGICYAIPVNLVRSYVKVASSVTPEDLEKIKRGKLNVDDLGRRLR